MAGDEQEREADAGPTGVSGATPEPAAARTSETSASGAGATSSPQAEPDHSLAEVARARRRRVVRAVVLLVLFLVLVLFIVANSQPVEADFLVFKAHPRLIWVMVTCGVLGIVIGYLLGRPGHEGRPRKKKDGGAPAG
jgi:uncharacterized integral membrane protein